MQRYCLLSLAFLQILTPSFQVNISPCKVENLVTQPIYGTSSKTKALVQIIQIPPVFTQNVIVGRCISSKENSGYPNVDPEHPSQYFLCRQRYSSVEVYVSDQALYPSEDYTSQSDLSPLQKFRTQNFIRDSVLVESGCDFTFNLLPLLLPSKQPHHQKHEDQHVYNFLRSPYHPTHPEMLKPSTIYLNSSSYVHRDADRPEEAVTYNQGGNDISYGTNNLKNYTTPDVHNSAIYSNGERGYEGGVKTPKVDNRETYSNGERGYEGGFKTPEVHNSETYSNRENGYEGGVKTPDVNNSETYSNGESGYGEGVTSVISTSYPVINDYERNSPKVTLKGGTRESDTYQIVTVVTDTEDDEPQPHGYIVGQGDEAELHALSDKIGVPLLILSRKFDPLLNNIEGEYFSN